MTNEAREIRWKNAQGYYAAFSIGLHKCVDMMIGKPCGDENCNVVDDINHKRIIKEVPPHIVTAMVNHGFHRVEYDANKN